MDETTLMIAATCLLAGLVVGALLARALSPREQKRRELEEKLRNAEDELKIYQRDVADHLLRTSELVEDMNRSQREFSEQLARSAMQLAAPEVSRKVQNAVFGGLATDVIRNIYGAIPAEPPKDYAPGDPDNLLREDYGLEDAEEPVTVRGLHASREDDEDDMASPPGTAQRAN